MSLEPGRHAQLQISYDKCQGHARCFFVAPALFDIDEDGRGIVRSERIEQSELTLARAAIENCPEQAIALMR